ncbi:hypothetical protein ACFHYQ_13685 [Sphaerimonospora cavernae]|uniref:Uncharacterized protein n=1 Tax=Sphaerimonospora cavernae TaxID=1740611 RepID=A0ABV6U4F4_9ACTN
MINSTVADNGTNDHARGDSTRDGCPPWCMDAHIDEHPDERIHNAWVQAVDLHAIPLAGLPQRLWLDLVLCHGDHEPRVTSRSTIAPSSS